MKQPNLKKIKLNAILDPRGQCVVDLAFINSLKIIGACHSDRSRCKVTHSHSLNLHFDKKERENERVRRGRGLSLSHSLPLSLRCNIYYFHRLLTVCWVEKTKHLLGRWFAGLLCLMIDGWSRDFDDEQHIF